MQLVEGYAEHAKRIDELIAQYAVGWTLDRMPVVDRNILRLGAYELICGGRAPGRRVASWTRWSSLAKGVLDR